MQLTSCLCFPVFLIKGKFNLSGGRGGMQVPGMQLLTPVKMICKPSWQTVKTVSLLFAKKGSGAWGGGRGAQSGGCGSIPWKQWGAPHGLFSMDGLSSKAG